MKTDERYMQRCLQLARLGAGNVAPNPMVGSVLVHEHKIIGEGYHQQYGYAHAEVNCMDNVKENEASLIRQSTMYVSLEPCAHWGKTPPCADLIIRKQIPKVVIGCCDPFEQVDGKGIEKLRAAGVEVVMSSLEKECIELNKRFFTFHTKRRPYIILKWAQTADGNTAALANERLLISHEFTNRLVHRWRSEEAAILVGTNTALLDNPKLDNRYWTGKSPVRLVLDKQLRLPATLHLFDKTNRTVVLNTLSAKKTKVPVGVSPTGSNMYSCMETTNEIKEEEHLSYYKIETNENTPAAICAAGYDLSLQSIIIEGGATLLQAFIDTGLWDEARIITNQTLFIGKALPSPVLQHHQLIATEQIHNDRIAYFIHTLT